MPVQACNGIALPYIIYIVRPLDLIPSHEGVWRNGNKTPHIFNIGITVRRLVGFRPRSLYFRGRIVREGLKSVWVLYEETGPGLYQESNPDLPSSNESLFFLCYEAVRYVVR